MIEQAPHRMGRESAHRRFLRIGIDALVVALVLLNWIATQLIAAALHYPPFFMGRIIGHLYQPFAWWWWQYHWPHNAVQIGREIIPLERAWTVCDHVVFYPTIALVIVGGVISGLLLKRRGPADLHGSAMWGGATEARDADLLTITAMSIYLATWPGSFGRRAPLRDRGEGHVCVIAPARSGKGVGVVIPTLLTWPASLVVMDIKGENFRLSAGRRKQFGNVVLKFDPTSPDSCHFNPFDEVSVGADDEWGDIDNIATSLLDPRGKGAVMDSHWDRQGVGWVGACIYHLLHREEDKTLRGLASLISGSADKEGILGTIKRMRGANAHPTVSQEMQMMLDKSPNERSGIISTVQGFLKVYRDPLIAAATSKSDFRIADLMHHQRPVSVYLVIPVKDMDRIQPLLRLVLNQAVKGLTPRMEGAKPRHKLLLMLDEFCVLGHMELLSKMLPFVPGYGIRACVVAQNLTQIEAAYGHDQPIVQTCETLLALTPNRDDIQTAEFLSKLAGDTTVVERHRSWSSSGPSTSEQKTRRPLITPGEVLELATSKALIFKRGAKPLLADQFVYYRHAKFQQWSQIKPPVQSDQIYQGVEYAALPQADKSEAAEAVEEPYWKQAE